MRLYEYACISTTPTPSSSSSSECSNLGDFSPQGTERTTFTFYKSLERERDFVFVCVCVCAYVRWRVRDREKRQREKEKNHENPILCPICLKKCGMREGRGLSSVRTWGRLEDESN